MRSSYDVRMETTLQNDEDFLHWRSDQFYRSGHHDSYRHDQHWRHACVEIQAVPLVYVTQAVIQGTFTEQPAEEAGRSRLKLFI